MESNVEPHKKSRYEEDIGFRPEQYYEILIDYTPKTVFFDLSRPEAEAIIRYYFDSRKHQFTLNDYSQLQSIQTKIKEAQKVSGFKQFFVRLSHRSPKDGQPYDVSFIQKEYEEFQEREIEDYDEAKQANNKLCFFFRIGSEMLKCKNQKDAMNLLLSSERVAKDLRMVMEHVDSNPTHTWHNKGMLRQWCNKMQDNLEFRCFVKNNTFRALSQYNHYIYVDLLQKKEVRDQIRHLIIKYWNHKIKAKLAYLSEYVIDFAILDLKKGELCVIELNPYQQTTGPALMQWHSDQLSSTEWGTSEENVTFAYNKQQQMTNRSSVYAEICQQQMEESITADNYEQYLKKTKILNEDGDKKSGPTTHKCESF